MIVDPSPSVDDHGWLLGHPDPLVRARAAVVLGGTGTRDEAVLALQAAARDDVRLSAIADGQHADGSWGNRAAPSARVLTTLLAVRSLTDTGLTDRTPMVAAALDFLADQAVVSGGCAIGGRRDTVLPCYTGLLAEAFLRGDRPDRAEPLLAWIADHQQLRFAGTDHAPGAVPWADYLRTRYGGCFAATSCLIGAVAGIGALVAARRFGVRVPSRAETLMDGLRRVLSQRRVCHSRGGGILPLAGRTRADPDGTRWLAPVFPRGYLPDLLELTQLAVALEVPADRLTPARESLGRWRLPDGRWLMGGTRTLAVGFRPEPRSMRRPSAWVTLRYLDAATPQP